MRFAFYLDKNLGDWDWPDWVNLAGGDYTEAEAREMFPKHADRISELYARAAETGSVKYAENRLRIIVERM